VRILKEQRKRRSEKQVLEINNPSSTELVRDRRFREACFGKIKAKKFSF